MRPVNCLLMALVASLSCLSPGYSDEPTSNPDLDLEEIYARLAEFEQRLSYQESRTPTPVLSQPCHPCSTEPGVIFGAELLFLKPFQSEGESPGFDYEPASRLWIGWVGNEGLGARVRWFDYDGENPNAAPVDTSVVEVTVVDFEITDKFKLGHWEGILSGGLRYADYLEFSFFDLDTMEDSLGPVLGVQLFRPLHDNLSIFGTARGSIQFAARGLDTGGPERDMTFTITEMQLGLQYTRPGFGGGEWFVRGAFEGQYWSGGTIGDGDTEAAGLVGGTIAIGLTR